MPNVDGTDWPSGAVSHPVYVHFMVHTCAQGLFLFFSLNTEY